MRYAEVEQYNGSYRLLRLGSCDFEFEAGRDIFDADRPAHLDTIAEAVADVFGGTVATELRVAIHPPVGQAFFSPCAVSLTPAACRQQLEREAVLLSGQDPAAFSLATDPVREEALPDGETVQWYQTLVLPRTVSDRIGEVSRVLQVALHRPMTSMQGVAQVLTCLARRQPQPPGRPLTLALGWYPARVEVVVCRGHSWVTSLALPGGPAADVLFATVMLLHRLQIDPGDVGQVYVYGIGIQPDAFDLFERAFGAPPEKLNAVPVVNLDPASLAVNFDVEAYAPCIGICL